MKVFLNLVSIFGLSIILIILFILWKKKNMGLNHRILFIFFLQVLIVQCNFIALINGIRGIYLVTNFIADIMVLGLALTFWFYVKSLFGVSALRFKEVAFHLIPALIYFFSFTLPFYAHTFWNISVGNYIQHLKDFDWLIIIIVNSYAIVYMALTLQTLRRNKLTLKGFYSDLTNIDVSWIEFVVIATLLILGVDLILAVFQEFNPEASLNSYGITIGLSSISQVYMGYKGISQTRILLPSDFFLQNEDTNPSANKSIGHPMKLSDPESMQRTLEEVMIATKAFLDEDLTLHKLAVVVGISEKKLSVLLNHYMKTSFYDFVNVYRVNAVKKELLNKENENFTIMAIANHCGFKSKSSFHRIFKRETGFSPKQYIEITKTKN